MIFIYETIYNHFSIKFINEMNFKYQQEFDDETTTQLFIFNLFNTFFPFCYTAFVLYKYSTLFSMLISTILLDQVKTNVVRYLRYHILYKRKMDMAAAGEEGQESVIATPDHIPSVKSRVERQVAVNMAMQENDADVVAEYMDMAMQFGLIALFSNVLPVISLFCFLANIIKLKAIQLEFRYKKRGDPELSFGIGQFLGIFEFISHAAILINVSIGAFTSTRYAAMAKWESVQLSDLQLLLGFVFVEHVLLFLKMFIAV